MKQRRILPIDTGNKANADESLNATVESRKEAFSKKLVRFGCFVIVLKFEYVYCANTYPDVIIYSSNGTLRSTITICITLNNNSYSHIPVKNQSSATPQVHVLAVAQCNY